MTLRTEFFSPRGLLVAGFALWLLVRLSIWFITYESAPAEVAMLVMGLYVGGFLLGTFTFSRPRDGYQPRPPNALQVRRLRRVAALLVVVAVGFLLLRFYDILFIRGLLEAQDIQEFRNAQNTVVGDAREVTGISFVSGIGYPLAVPVLVLTIAFRKYLGLWQALVGYGVFGLYAFYVVLSGNRFILLGPLLLAAVAWSNSRGAFRLSRQHITAILSALVVLQIYVANGSVRRDRLYGVDSHVEALNVAPERRLYSVSPAFLDWYAHQPSIIQDIIYGQINLAWYVTHGMYEFPKVWQYADPDDKSWGGFQFSGVTYFFRLIGFETPSDQVWSRNLPSYGFYTTFFGPVYIDFGVLYGTVYCVALGALAQWAWVLMRRGRISGIFLYPFTASVIVNMPVSNMIDAGIGVPILALSIAVALFVRLSVGGHWKTSWTAVSVPPKLSRHMRPRPAYSKSSRDYLVAR